MRNLLRQPLVHFVALGLALFVLDAAVGSDEGSTPARTDRAESGLPVPSGPIVVDESVRATLSSHWSQTHDAPPSAAQLDELVDRWIDREVLYREGLARGLAIGDAEIHERVASQMAYVLGEQLVVPEPTDAQLRDWLDTHRDRFSKADRVDFTQVFVAGTDAAAESRARELLALLEAGAAPEGLGDTYRGGRRFRGRTIEALTVRFGEAFTASLDTQPPQTWSLRRSDEGLHLVRVDRRDAARAAAFDEVRDAVRHDWQRRYRAEQLTQATARLRDKWDIVQS